MFTLVMWEKSMEAQGLGQAITNKPTGMIHTAAVVYQPWLQRLQESPVVWMQPTVI